MQNSRPLCVAKQRRENTFLQLNTVSVELGLIGKGLPGAEPSDSGLGRPIMGGEEIGPDLSTPYLPRTSNRFDANAASQSGEAGAVGGCLGAFHEGKLLIEIATTGCVESAIGTATRVSAVCCGHVPHRP
jgi:hypothetical protein